MGMAPGWYPWNAEEMRYWDGTAWDAKRKRADAEVSPRESSKQSARWLVRFGYTSAVLLPAVGLILGIVVATRSKDSAGERQQGVTIIVLSVVVFVIGVLLSKQ